MVCPECGKNCNANDIFCNNCGHLIDNTENQSKENQPNSDFLDDLFADEHKIQSHNDNLKKEKTDFDDVFGDLFLNDSNEDTNDNIKQKDKNNNSKTGLLIILLVLVLIALVVVIVLFLKLNGKKNYNIGDNGVEQTIENFNNYDSTSYSNNYTDFEYKTTTTTSTYNYSQQHTYRVIQADVSWYEAKAECEQCGGHLATITTQSEYDEICRLAESSGLKYIWLGARIYSISDSFDEWITGESMNFTKWYPGEPSKTDVDGTEEFYLCLWNVKYNGNDMGWTFNDQRNDLLSESSVKSGSVGYVIEYDN